MAKDVSPDPELKEALLSEKRALEFDADDETLIKEINRAIGESKGLKEEIDKIGERNEKIWKKGTDIDLEKLAHPKKAKLVDNRIFFALETILPIVTARTPEPIVVGEGATNEVNEKIVNALQIVDEVEQKMQFKRQQLIRHWGIYRIGVLKYRWDEERGFVTEVVLPKLIGFDPRATHKDNCEFIYEYVDDTLEDLIKKFPEKKKELLKEYGEDHLQTRIRYIEFWGGGGEWVAWKAGKILLHRKRNPNWDYEDEDKNLFDRPRFPYLFFTVFGLGKMLYDETTLIEQAMPVQEAANKLLRQIIDLNEGQMRTWIGSGDAITREDFAKLIQKTGDLGVYLEKGDVSGLQLAIAGKPDASLFTPLSFLVGEIDNIFGTHATTRGERKEQETFGGRMLLVQSDYGRLEPVIRNLDDLMEDWYNAYLHMFKVYQVDEKTFAGNETVVNLSPNEIPNNIRVMVKKGSTLPVDKESRREMALQLARVDKIDPETLFEEAGYGNAEERRDRLYRYYTITGKANPQLLAGVTGGGGSEQATQPPETGELARLQAILGSPEFQSAPDEKKLAVIQRVRQLLEKYKAIKPT